MCKVVSCLQWHNLQTAFAVLPRWMILFAVGSLHCRSSHMKKRHLFFTFSCHTCAQRFSTFCSIYFNFIQSRGNKKKSKFIVTSFMELFLLSKIKEWALYSCYPFFCVSAFACDLFCDKRHISRVDELTQKISDLI